jgi:[NiFe] hydrogenase diaphorase moiety small subunit
MTKNTLSIDGKKILFKAGQTIMDAALAAKIYIPALCHNVKFKPHGSCKLCTIQVNGRTCSACTTPASDGQEILNNTQALNETRRMITQLLFVEGNHICPSCEKSGNCQLQAIAYHLNMLDNHYPHFFPRREIDASHADILLDRDRCIYCELCVRASRNCDGKHVFDIGGRGINAQLMVNSSTGQLKDSDLSVNDQAAHICPVGAILIKHHAYETPIGQRNFDNNDIADTSLATNQGSAE